MSVMTEEEMDYQIELEQLYNNKNDADAEREFQNSDYWNDYLAKVIADAKAEMIDEFKRNLFNREFYRCTDGNEYIDVADIEYVAEQLKKGNE